MNELRAEADKWGVPIDEDLASQLADAEKRLSNLMAARATLESQHGMIESADKALVCLASGGTLDDALVPFQKSAAIKVFIPILVEAIADTERETARLRMDAAYSLRYAKEQRQSARRQRWVEFRQGRAERPIGERAGQIQVICESCHRTIGTVNADQLSHPLSPTAFRSGVSPLFASTFQCPICKCRAVSDARWVLTELWEYVAVPDDTGQAGQEVCPDLPKEPRAETDGHSTRNEAILAMRAQGKSERTIAQKLGLAKSTIHDILRRSAK